MKYALDLINMGCGLSSIKEKTIKSTEEDDLKPTHTFSLRKYKRLNPKYLKLAEGLFQVKEASESRESSFVTLSFTL